MLKTTDTEHIFKELLAKKKLNYDNYSLDKILEVFEEFMEIDFGVEEDDVLFETGTFYGKDIFTVDIVRQFSIYNQNEYDHMEQFHVTVQFVNTRKLKELNCTEWSMDYNDISDFFNSIKKLKEYIYPIKHSKIIELKIGHDFV